jgi:hypothetical protein
MFSKLRRIEELKGSVLRHNVVGGCCYDALLRLSVIESEGASGRSEAKSANVKEESVNVAVPEGI